MDKAKITEYINNNDFETLEVELKKDIEKVYDEYSMLMLAKVLYHNDKAKEGKKCFNKLRRLFPCGDYFHEINELADAIENGKAISIKNEEIVSEEAKVEPQQEKINAELIKKEKKQRKFNRSIRERFSEKSIQGMNNLKMELDTFYNRLNMAYNTGNMGILQDTLFSVSGERGSGKTTVCGIIAGLLYDFGIRNKDGYAYIDAKILALIEPEKREEYCRDIIKPNKTIVIDNIDELVGKDIGQVGKEIKEILYYLHQSMRMHRDDVSVIFTGSEAALAVLYEIDDIGNDITRRFKIDKYSTDELLTIALNYARENGMSLSDVAKERLREKIDRERYRTDFKNYYSIKEYIDLAIDNHANNYSLSMDDETLYNVLQGDDFGEELDGELLSKYIDELNNLTGLSKVKSKINEQINIQKYNLKMKEKGHFNENQGALHMIFAGSPGTGKTTVARLIGNIYKQLGILDSGDKTIECKREDLVGEYMGQTAVKVKEKVKEALGGVLFIDEAYALKHGKDDNFGQEAIDTLLAEIENNRDNLLVILAGYEKEMEGFLDTNPGLRSRIPNYILFEDYTTDEMVQIFKYMVNAGGLRLETEAEELLYKVIDFRKKTLDFGNARGIRNLFEESCTNMKQRCVKEMEKNNGELSDDADCIKKCDVEKLAEIKQEKEATIDELLEELNSMIGLESVKKKVNEIINIITVQKYMNDGVFDRNAFGSMHMQFVGNAGTGKTEVAKLFGKILMRLGVLKKDIVRIVKREDFVAEFVGQTAPKTKSLIEKTDGGILFIDEAYNLVVNSNGGNDTFGMEAINTLIPEMEARKDSLIVIIAGYEKEISELLSRNQGLGSRFSQKIVFEDYSDEELTSIFYLMMKKQGYAVADDIRDFIKEKLVKRKSELKDFGNARGVRNVVDEVIRKQQTRIACLLRTGETPDKKQLKTIIKEDIQDE